MPTPALDALLPVATLIAVGGLAARLGWVKASSLSDLSNLAFKVLAPALLFTSMSHVYLDQVALKPVGVYFMSIAVVFALVLLRHGGGVLGAVRALGATFSNTLNHWCSARGQGLRPGRAGAAAVIVDGSHARGVEHCHGDHRTDAGSG